MFPFCRIKIRVFLAMTALFFSSCGSGQKTENETSAPTPFVARELKSEIPFSTAEPEVFQTEIIVSANNQESVYFIARNGLNRRYDFNYTGKNRISVLQIDKNYLIFPDKKIYAENPTDENQSASESRTDFLTTEWLNQRINADYERLEPENNLAKYRVRLNDSDSSESIIYVDESRGFPVRQEFYSINGEQRVLIYAFELRNTKMQTDENAFFIPKDFRRVSIEEFRKISRAVQP